MKQETIEEVWLRSCGFCENPNCQRMLTTGYENHHIYWKSQYKGADRHEPWNIAALCYQCHYSIHSQANTTLDKYLKAQADIRKPKESRVSEKDSSLDRAKVARKREYRRKIESFKATHGGLSPTQYQYRQKKMFSANVKKS